MPYIIIITYAGNNNDFMLKLNFKSLLDLQTQLATEEGCKKYMIDIRWNVKVERVYCNYNKVCTVKDGDFKCSKCNKNLL